MLSRMRLKNKTLGLSQRHEMALDQYLKPRVRRSLEPTLKLETLELAQIHERAVMAMSKSAPEKGATARVESLFFGTQNPLEFLRRN